MTRPIGVEEVYKYIASIISECEVIPTAEKLPSYRDLRSSPDKFYEMFSEATYRYNIICDSLQKLQYSNAMIVKALNELMSPESREQYNVKSQYIKNFTNVKAECTALISGYETAKSSAEAVVKFYNSAQYVICSSKFDAQTANY